jgi:hypothetical protein
MFGFRSDGRRIKNADPIVGFTPYLMPQRVDSQVNTSIQLDCDALTNYIRSQREKGHVLSYMDIIIAGSVRALSQYPQLNRFVMNKQLFARSTICISLAILKTGGNDEEVRETAIKVHFDPYDTIYDVHNRMQEEIDQNRKEDNQNSADKLVRFLLAIPGLPTCAVHIVKLLDRYGIMPSALVNLSPFHTGAFIANMASIGMPHVNHHIYNFGTTSMFLAMGKALRNPMPGPNGGMIVKRELPIGLVLDERITSGAEYGRAVALFRELLLNPEKLEQPPETVKYDIPPEKMSRKMRKHIKPPISAGA